MFEDIYFWTKNGRPDADKNHDRNRSCHYILRGMKTDGVIMKTYHVDPNDNVWDEDFQEKMDRTLLHQDLIPFIKYSINKKKRWETESGIEVLTELQKIYRGMDVVISDRVWIKSSPYWCFVSYLNYFHNFFNLFPIREIHHLDINGSYKCLSSDSVYGQPYKSLLPDNRSPRKTKKDSKVEDFSIPKVAYHLITPPKNYEKLRNKEFQPGSSDRWGHRTLVHWRRFKVMRDALLSLRYEEFEDLDGNFYDHDYGYFEDSCHDDYDSPRECYNLEDHLVDKYVFVKRKTGKTSEDFSTWSVISDN